VIAVFSYGTLSDPEFQRALFDVEVPTQPAMLRDWMTVLTPSGYLTIVPAPGAILAGAIVHLDDAQRATADAWEEVPLYEARAVRAERANGEGVACIVYVQPSASRDPAPAHALAGHDRATVLAAIRAFRATRGSGA
jgi:gamma-glutamylcyclotransferase (GGCT)/AIG2-like uncharacterized protein YtfP